jgi:hypothetical protein
MTAHSAARATCVAKSKSVERCGLLTWALLVAAACTARNPAYMEPTVSPRPEADATEPLPFVPRDAAVGDGAPSSPDVSKDPAPDLPPANDATVVAVDATPSTPDLAPDLVPDKPPPGKALLVVGDTNLSKSDAQLRTVLESLAFTVTAKTDKASAAADAAGKALVVISGSSASAEVGSKFRDVKVPVVVFDASVFGPMKMTGTHEDIDFGTVTGEKRVAIVDPAQPMAAGLSGTITVANDVIQVSWGAPSSSAIKVATVAGQANHYALFAYATGSTMVGQAAPAARVGAFVRYPEAATYTNDGLALFRAVVLWAAGP